MDIIDEKREKFGPKLQEFAALRMCDLQSQIE